MRWYFRLVKWDEVTNVKKMGMDHLHAYWRMAYIERPKDSSSNNPFLELPQKTDKEALIVHRRKTCYLVLNKFPYNAGHLLVIPYRAVSFLDELQGEEKMDFWEGVLQAEALVRRALKPDGLNVGFNLGGAAGAGIPEHLHCHIVPRWAGDTNFMPVVGQTKVLSQALETMWERLRSFI